MVGRGRFALLALGINALGWENDPEGSPVTVRGFGMKCPETEEKC